MANRRPNEQPDSRQIVCLNEEKGAMKKRSLALQLAPLDPRHYNEDRVMIGHQVVPMDQPSGGVYWCRVCGGHPDDPIHQPGYLP